MSPNSRRESNKEEEEPCQARQQRPCPSRAWPPPLPTYIHQQTDVYSPENGRIFTNKRMYSSTNGQTDVYSATNGQTDVYSATNGRIFRPCQGRQQRPCPSRARPPPPPSARCPAPSTPAARFGVLRDHIRPQSQLREAG